MPSFFTVDSIPLVSLYIHPFLPGPSLMELKGIAELREQTVNYFFEFFQTAKIVTCIPSTLFPVKRLLICLVPSFESLLIRYVSLNVAMSVIWREPVISTPFSSATPKLWIICFRIFKWYLVFGWTCVCKQTCKYQRAPSSSVLQKQHADFSAQCCQSCLATTSISTSWICSGDSTILVVLSRVFIPRHD